MTFRLNIQVTSAEVQKLYIYTKRMRDKTADLEWDKTADFENGTK